MAHIHQQYDGHELDAATLVEVSWPGLGSERYCPVHGDGVLLGALEPYGLTPAHYVVYDRDDALEAAPRSAIPCRLCRPEVQEAKEVMDTLGVDTVCWNVFAEFWPPTTWQAQLQALRAALPAHPELAGHLEHQGLPVAPLFLQAAYPLASIPLAFFCPAGTLEALADRLAEAHREEALYALLRFEAAVCRQLSRDILEDPDAARLARVLGHAFWHAEG